jgi:hypothetical protein
LRYEDLLKERVDYKNKIEHLQEAVKTNYSALVNMTQEASKLRKAKEESESAFEELRVKYKELETGSSILQDKMRLYSGEEGINIEELERALTVVKRRGESVRKLDFLEDVDGGLPQSIPLMKKKLEDVQVINLNLTKEVERLEGMLKLQSDIGKDLHKELESTVRKNDSDKRDLMQKVNELDRVVSKKQEKILMLEAQLRQHIYSVSKGTKTPTDQQIDLLDASAADALSATGDIQSDLISELINEKDGNIPPDQNLLEVWVKSGTILDRVLTPGSSTFIVIDFFDYESQATTLISGSKPKWDFAASYKLTVDDFLFRYFSTDVIAFELNMVRMISHNFIFMFDIYIHIYILNSYSFVCLFN